MGQRRARSRTTTSARSGHYAGTTSQGLPIAFDVASDLTSVSGIDFYVDLTCSEVGVTVKPNAHFWIMGNTPLAPDWSFLDNATGRYFSLSLSVSFSGKLSPPGMVSGTFKQDVIFYNVEGIGTAHCSSGNVTWTASCAEAA